MVGIGDIAAGAEHVARHKDSEMVSLCGWLLWMCELGVTTATNQGCRVALDNMELPVENGETNWHPSPPPRLTDVVDARLEQHPLVATGTSVGVVEPDALVERE